VKVNPRKSPNEPTKQKYPLHIHLLLVWGVRVNICIYINLGYPELVGAFWWICTRPKNSKKVLERNHTRALMRCVARIENASASWGGIGPKSSQSERLKVQSRSLESVGLAPPARSNIWSKVLFSRCGLKRRAKI